MSDTQSSPPPEEQTAVEIFRRDPPQKCHVVAERPEKHVVITECGLRFESPERLPIHTSTLYPEKSLIEQTVTAPVPEARCGNCPWEERLE